MSGEAFNRGVCRGNRSLWFGLVGEGSRRPIWIWGNPDSPSEEELCLRGAHSQWAMAGRLCLHLGYCFMVCFFPAKPLS